MNRNRLLDLWVGLFVVIGIGALLFLSLKAANSSSISTDKSYRVEARFEIGRASCRERVYSSV